MRQIQWSEYEVAYLIYQYWLIEYRRITREEAIQNTSRILREYAKREGINVDEKYRNENGIGLRLEELRYLFSDGQKGVMNTSALFRIMVVMYQKESRRFHQILNKAKQMFETESTLSSDSKYSKVLESPSAVEINTQEELLDWYNETDLFCALPVRCTFFNHNVPFSETWEMLYVALVGAIYDTYPYPIENLINDPSLSIDGPYLVNSFGIDNMSKPKRVRRGIYLETACTPKRIIANLRLLFSMCGIDFENVSIYYQTRQKTSRPKQISIASKLISPPVSPVRRAQPKTVPIEPESPKTEAKKTVTPPANNGIISVLKNHFPYGFKPDSIRDLMRFRMFAEEESIELPESDEELRQSISSVSTVMEGKWFAQSDEVPEQLEQIISDIFADGTAVIYYEALLEEKSEWMQNQHITSESLLKEMLQKHFPKCYYAKRFMTNSSQHTEYEAVSAEICRIWGEKATKSVEDIKTDLPYIPIGNIWRAISRSPLFERVSEGVYFLTDKLIITEEECDEVLEYAERACAENGFASLGDLPLESVEEQNYEIPLLTIQAAVYSKLLADRFTLNGRILTSGNTELSSVVLLKQYLAEKDECTFDELDAKNLELTGAPNRRNVFQALYDSMIRINENRFVKPHLVEFQIDEIDRVLAGFITNHFCAVKDITTFVLFPLCGQTWNHYLLESFCYKYSRRFSLRVINFNNKNAGIIAEKDYSKNYIDMLALVLSKTDIELTSEVIGPYLFQNGYLAKSKYGRLEEIAAKAKALRKDS